MSDQAVVCIGIVGAIGFLVFSYLVMWIFGDFPLARRPTRVDRLEDE